MAPIALHALSSPGTTSRSLEHSYEQVRSIGRGSFGEATLVKDSASKLCVMKTIDITRLDEEQQLEAVNEVKVLSSLKHPYIVRYHESFVENGTLAIVMDYAEGGDLAKRIALHHEKNQPFTEPQVLRWFAQVALGLKYLHGRQIIHRDLKPQNIFLTKDDLRLGDFGISKVLGSSSMKEDTTIGTPYYFSPEICQEKLYSFASDIWALGCVLYELAALHVPFEAQNILSLIRKITTGRLPSFPSAYSKELRLLDQELLCRDYSLRPSAVEILQNQMIQTEMRQMLNEKPARSLSSTVSTTASWSDPISSPPLNLGRNLDLERLPAQCAGRHFDLDSKRLLGTVLNPLAHNKKELRRSPTAPAGTLPLAQGRPTTLRRSSSSALISSNGATKASPEITKRVDSELKTPWGADFAKDQCSRAAPTALCRAVDKRADRRQALDENRRASREGGLCKDLAGSLAVGHFGGNSVTNLNAKRYCASKLLGMGAPCCGANRGLSRTNQRRLPALPVWQDIH